MHDFPSATSKTGLSGSTLKLIAITTMLLDHIGATLVWPYLLTAVRNAGLTSWSYTAILSACPSQAIPYFTLRLIGRIAFPIFCFLLVEGFLHTKNLPRYCLRLALFALISEIPFDLAFEQTFFNPTSQNVFFTLFIGLLTIACLKQLETQFDGSSVLLLFGRLLILLCGMTLARILHTDYSFTGVLVIGILYELRRKRTAAVSISCALLCYLSVLEVSAFVSVPLIKRYNGQRGISLKYIFYLFYPAHLLALYFLTQP